MLHNDGVILTHKNKTKSSRMFACETELNDIVPKTISQWLMTFWGSQWNIYRTFGRHYF